MALEKIPSKENWYRMISAAQIAKGAHKGSYRKENERVMRA